MSEWLKWWIAGIVVGLVILVVAIPAKDNAAILVGLGIITAGFGGWIDRANRAEPALPDEAKSEKPSQLEKLGRLASGPTLSGLGALLFVVGVILLIFR